MSFPRPTFLSTAAAFLAGICLCWNTLVPAQDLPEAKTKPKAAAKQPAEAKAAVPASTGPARLEPPEDPVVAALLVSNPTTPSDVFHTAQLLLQASRPELAKKYLRKLLDAKLDDGQWASLIEEYHTTALTDLAERRELRPESEQLARAAFAALDRRSHDPAQLAEAIKQLQDPSPQVRGRAIANLQQAHAAAVDALIAVLADPQRAAEHAAVRQALAAMRGDAIDPLADMLERADPEFAVEAIRALAATRATQATVYLYAPALAEESDVRVRGPAREAIQQLQGYLPTPAQAAQQLDELARSYYAGKQSFRTDLNGRATLWTWDAANKRCVARTCLPEDAARAVAARLARAAQSLAPANRAGQTLATAAELEEIVYGHDLDKPLDFKDADVARLAKIDPRAIEDVLSFCLNEHHPAGARAAAEILGHNPAGKGQELLQGGAGFSPLVRAAGSADARVRIAALESIAALQPKSPFPGSSLVLESLAFQAGTTGGRRALAASPNTTTLEEWIGALKFRAIETDVVSVGKEVVRMACRCPDYEMAVIDMAIQTPPAEEIVQKLRHDYRTSGLRIALVARAGFLPRAERIAEGDPLTLAFSRPIDAATARWQLGQINLLTPRDFVGFSERQELAVRALDCLAKLNDNAKGLFDIQRAEAAALAGAQVPRLSVHAMALLSSIGTQASQQALADVAGRAANPVPLRQAAAVAFKLNVQRYGVLLPQESIRQQYRRYQQSGEEEAAARTALASLLTAIESRATPSSLEAARTSGPPEKVPPQPKKRIEN